jgi:succinate dehydrogenase / fumarate reductase membrane anchor subunit
MVMLLDTVTSLSTNGLKDWLIQRVSAVILAAYTLFLLFYFIAHPHLEYSQWHALFSCGVVRFFTLLTLLSLVLHAWIGLWTVLTDYVKIVSLRLVLQVLVILTSFAYLAWGIQIIWGS